MSDFKYVGVQGVCSAESDSLSRVDRVGLAVAGCFAFSLAWTDDCVGAVFTGLYPIASRLVNRKRQVGGIDLKDIVPVQAPHPNVKRA